MKSLILTPLLLLFIYLNSFSQKNDIDISPWTIGTGVNNFAMHGDLTSDSPNLGYYLYLNKMITPAFGFELKGQILNTKGNSQDTFGTLPEYNATNLRFNGETFGGDLSLVLNLSALNTTKFVDRKFNVTSYFGLGYHTYSAKLYNDDTNELLADFSSRNSDVKSIYYTSGIGLKYRLSERLDLELRQSINFNNEDHLDAAVSSKQHLETFFTTQLGIVIKLHKKGRRTAKTKENKIKEEIIIAEKSITELIDTDQDGVIDQFDKEPNTDRNAFVYANGVAIDSDKDGIPDHLDKCPLVKGNNKVGCLDDANLGVLEPKKMEKIIPVKTEVEKPIIKKVIPVIKVTTPVVPVKKIIDNKLSEYDKEKALIESIIAGAQNMNTDPSEVKETILETVTETPTPEIITEEDIINNPNIELIKALNKKNIKHNIRELDNSVNHLDIEVSPVYPGCENQITNLDKENCMITKLSIFSLKNFNSSQLSHLKLGSGTKLMRIVFVVDKNGKSKAYKAITNWQPEVIQEMKRVIKSLPTMKPGLLKNIPTPVKYSIEVPFKTSN